MSITQQLKVSEKLVYHSGAICLRRTVNRKSKYKKLVKIPQESILQKEGLLMVNSEHPNAKEFNLLIYDEWIQWQKKSIQIQMGIIPPIQFKKDEKPVVTAFEALLDYQRRLDREHKLTARRKAYNVAKLIMEYGDKPLNKTNRNYWEDFKKYLLSKPVRQNSDECFGKGTIKRYFGVLKTAIDYEQIEDARVEKSIHNIKHDAVNVKVKAKLTTEEFIKIKDIDLPPKLALSRDIFCTQIFLWGTRISDTLMLKPENLRGNFDAVFKELKTGKTKTLHLHDKAKYFYTKYKGQSDYYVFPMLTLPPVDAKTNVKYRKHIESKTAVLNNHLKIIAAKCGIDKVLSSHVARHSFAYWAYKNDVPERKISEMLNHGSVRVTRDYLRELTKSEDLNDQADKIFDFKW